MTADSSPILSTENYKVNSQLKFTLLNLRFGFREMALDSGWSKQPSCDAETLLQDVVFAGYVLTTGRFGRRRSGKWFGICLLSGLRAVKGGLRSGFAAARCGKDVTFPTCVIPSHLPVPAPQIFLSVTARQHSSLFHSHNYCATDLPAALKWVLKPKATSQVSDQIFVKWANWI